MSLIIKRKYNYYKKKTIFGIVYCTVQPVKPRNSLGYVAAENREFVAREGRARGWGEPGWLEARGRAGEGRGG